MGFLTSLVSSVVKVALTPVAVVKDAVEIVSGNEPNSTRDLLSSAAEDVADAGDSLGDGELL